MDDQESLNHTKWECKYHIVFIPKCRRKKLYQQLRQDLGEVFRELAQVIGYIKGKSAIHISSLHLWWRY